MFDNENELSVDCGIKLNRSLNTSEIAQNNSNISLNKSDLKPDKNEDLRTGLLNTANNNNELGNNFEQKSKKPEVKISLSNKKTHTRKRRSKKKKSRNNSVAKKKKSKQKNDNSQPKCWMILKVLIN